jgi:hypothetical protein
MSFTILTTDPIPVVRERLASALTIARPGWFSEPTFRGNVSETGFRIIRNRARYYRASPMFAVGRFIAKDNGTLIEVNVRIFQWCLVLLCGFSIVFLFIRCGLRHSIGF